MVEPREQLHLPHEFLGHCLVLGIEGDALDGVDLGRAFQLCFVLEIQGHSKICFEGCLISATPGARYNCR